MMRQIFLTILLFVATAGYSFAQQPRFEGKAPQAVVAGDKFQLVYTLNDEGSDIRLPALQDFQILMGPSTSYSQSTSIVNGKVTRETTYSFTFILKALKEGSFTIPPASIMVDDKKVSSNAVKLKVVKGNAHSVQGRNQTGTTSTATGVSDKDVFIKVIPSKRNVYKGESLTLTTKLYSRVSIQGSSGEKNPDLSSFIQQKLEVPGMGSFSSKENIDGYLYDVAVIDVKLLFPQKSGKITIDPFELELGIRKRVARRSHSIFDDFFDSNYRVVKQKVKSKPITLTVKPHPTNRPAGFSGGVGKLDMKVNVTKREAKVNDGITLKVTISGTGNNKFVEEPAIKFPADFDDFDAKISNNITNTASGMKGTKTFEYLLIPRHAGTFTIPSIKFSYFDPGAGSYKSKNSSPITIHVEKGESDDEMSGTVVRSNVTRENVKFIGKDIRHIKTGKTVLKPIGTFLFGSLKFSLALLIPLFLFILIYLLNRKRLADNANMVMVRTKKANKVAKKRLKKSAHLLKTGEKEAFYEEVLKALYGYLSDKLSLPLSELSKDNAKEILMESKVSEELVQAFMDVLDTCEFARYAPASGSGEMDKLYQKTIETISKLENQVKR